MEEARMNIGRNKLTDVTFAFNSPNIIQKIFRCHGVGLKPKDDTSIVISKVVAPFLFPIYLYDALQSELNRLMKSVRLAGFFVRLLDSLTHCTHCGFRALDINISEHSLDGDISKVM
jgi:hypothetical protein